VTDALFLLSPIDEVIEGGGPGRESIVTSMEPNIPNISAYSSVRPVGVMLEKKERNFGAAEVHVTMLYEVSFNPNNNNKLRRDMMCTAVR
jgi:hypothetical protein